MIIKLEQDSSCEDVEILIKYATMNKEIQHVSELLNSINSKIRCSIDGKEKLVNVSDIYYIESVDKRTFVYCEKEVYKTELRLYQILQDLPSLSFTQISKSCILNLNMLDFIKPLLNSRMEAVLINGESLHITRKYLNTIKQALQGVNQK